MSPIINIGQTDAFLIELILSIEPRGVAHGHFGAKVTVTEIWPITNFAVADAYNVSETVAGKVREENSLSSVCKGDHGTFFFVPRLANSNRLAKAFFL